MDTSRSSWWSDASGGVHDVFQGTTCLGLPPVYPHLAGSWALTAAKWSIAGRTDSSASILLGMTFRAHERWCTALGPSDRGGNCRCSTSPTVWEPRLVCWSPVSIGGAGRPPRHPRRGGMLNLVVAGATLCVMVAARQRTAEASGGADGERLQLVRNRCCAGAPIRSLERCCSSRYGTASLIHLRNRLIRMLAGAGKRHHSLSSCCSRSSSVWLSAPGGSGLG